MYSASRGRDVEGLLVDLHAGGTADVDQAEFTPLQKEIGAGVAAQFRPRTLTVFVTGWMPPTMMRSIWL